MNNFQRVPSRWTVRSQTQWFPRGFSSCLDQPWSCQKKSRTHSWWSQLQLSTDWLHTAAGKHSNGSASCWRKLVLRVSISLPYMTVDIIATNCAPTARRENVHMFRYVHFFLKQTRKLINMCARNMQFITSSLVSWKEINFFKITYSIFWTFHTFANHNFCLSFYCKMLKSVVMQMKLSFD
jgi:hypothetical protein